MADPLTNETSQAVVSGGVGNRVFRNGVPLLPVRPGTPPVTPELVRQLQDELL